VETLNSRWVSDKTNIRDASKDQIEAIWKSENLDGSYCMTFIISNGNDRVSSSPGHFRVDFGKLIPIFPKKFFVTLFPS
jgi:hypothetical protein